MSSARRYKVIRMEVCMEVFYIDGLKVHEIHYGDPKIISKLIWLPYLEIIFFIFFILIAFAGLT